jgi:hypothetical protein
MIETEYTIFMWEIAKAISVLATEANWSLYSKAIRQRELGRARGPLLLDSWKMRNCPDVLEVLRDAISEEVAGPYAVAGLRKWGAKGRVLEGDVRAVLDKSPELRAEEARKTLRKWGVHD